MNKHPCILCNRNAPAHLCRRSYYSNGYNSSEEQEKSSEEDSSSEEEDFPPIPPPIKRQNTQWIVDGQVIFNGNPNGERLLATNYGLAHIEVSNNNWHEALEHLDDQDPIRIKINQILTLMTDVEADLQAKL